MVTVKFAFRRSIMVKRTSSRMNEIKGGFIRSYMSWEFVRLTVSSHITVPGTIKAHAKVENPIIGKNRTSNSNFSNATMAEDQKTGLATVKRARECSHKNIEHELSAPPVNDNSKDAF
jgi:hypothetical protein